MMRSYDSYRALVVLAIILAHMTGTLTVRVSGNKTKRQSGESSSSALILSLSFFAFFSLSSFPLHCMSVLLFLVQENDPRHLRHVRMPHITPPSSCHLLLPPSWYPLLDADALSDSSSAFLVRAISFLHSTFLDIYICYIYMLYLFSNTMCIFYFYFYTFYFPLLSLFHSLVFFTRCFLNCSTFSLFFPHFLVEF